MIAEEGDVSGRVVVQLRGRNIADDWSAVARRLQADLRKTKQRLPQLQVTPPPGGGLCQTYVTALGLPGCSDSVIAIANSLNPKVKEPLAADAKIWVPILPLHPEEWNVLLDQDIQRDALQLADFEQRWDIVKREEIEGFVRLTLRAYNVYLPDSTRKEDTIQQVISPQNDTVIKHLPGIPKRIVKDPVRNIIKDLFSVSGHYKRCRVPPPLTRGGGSTVQDPPEGYLSLLGNVQLPKCTCEGSACPQINLIDNRVYLHPDIETAVVGGGSDGEDRPPAIAEQCPSVDFNLADHHGTMMASIMVSRDDGSAPFIGLAPQAKLNVLVPGRSPNDLATRVRALAQDVQETPQVFVFAGEFDFGQQPNDVYSDEQIRKSEPAVVPAILETKVTWISAIGQPPVLGDGRQITPIMKHSPMNVGDQANVIIVTSCEDCEGADAHLWGPAYYSKKDGLVALAAPGGTMVNPIPAAATGYQYSEAYGTSQAAAFVGGITAAMLTCYPSAFKMDGRRVKMRLQTTADPMPRPEDAVRVTGGIVNPQRALLDPDKNWIKRGSNDWEEIKEPRWCRDSFVIQDPETGDKRVPAKAGQISSILAFHNSPGGAKQWQISESSIWDPTTSLAEPKVTWSGPGAWPDNTPIIAGKIAENGVDKDAVLSGPEIEAFVPKVRFNKIIYDAGKPCG